VVSESPPLDQRRDTAQDGTREPATALHLRLLGDFCLSCGDEPVTPLASVRLQSLLAYLALHREAPCARQQLAFLFWPDATEAQARNNLRQLVHHVRRVWPTAERFLAVDASALAWRRGVHLQLDVAEFEHALAQAEAASRGADPPAARAALEQAVGLYAGELLPGCYDDWLAPERERLAQRYGQALDRLLDLLEGQREYRAAIEYAQRRLRHDPLDEEAYRRLMRLHALNHDRASALRVYHACASLLEQELAVEPSPATREVYERLMHLAPSRRRAGRRSSQRRRWLGGRASGRSCGLLGTEPRRTRPTSC
jgi:DNA-binding SARP family transcriptional activator